jgi:hypothetical protein
MSDTDVYTKADVAQMVDNLAIRLGSRRKAADAMMVTPSYVTNVIDGSTNPGPAITDYFGLRKERKGIFVSALGDGSLLDEYEPERDILKELHEPRPSPRQDPMKRLRMDYVTLKLAGQIRIPKGPGKQIVLDI